MGLQLSKELSNGVVADYWRIVSVQMDFVAQRAQVMMALYLNEGARKAGKISLLNMPIMWIGADIPFSIDSMNKANPVEIAYNAVKATPEFLKAKDV